MICYAILHRSRVFWWCELTWTRVWLRVWLLWHWLEIAFARSPGSMQKARDVPWGKVVGSWFGFGRDPGTDTRAQPGSIQVHSTAHPHHPRTSGPMVLLAPPQRPEPRTKHPSLRRYLPSKNPGRTPGLKAEQYFV